MDPATINAGSHTIYVGPGALDKLPTLLRDEGISPGTRLFVVVDSITGEKCLPLLKERLNGDFPIEAIVIGNGEEHKNIDSCLYVWRLLLAKGADRDGVLLNLGGGMIGDLGGFCASVYKRGIRFVQIPTTLLAQVDASVGGKLGVDLDRSKNQLGLFRDPSAVIADPSFLETLPERELKAGFAEMVKHALILDRDLWERFRAMGSITVGNLVPHIERSIRMKEEVVREDPYEERSRRVLNFGHTLGHGIEAASYEEGGGALLHGEAVALGMIGESWLSMKQNGLNPEDRAAITEFLLEHFDLNAIPSSERVMHFIRQDKKNREGGVGLALLRGVGESDPDVLCGEDMVEKALEMLRQDLLRRQ